MSGTVTQQLAARLADLGPAVRRVAEFVLADPQAASELTIQQLADAAGSSTASVVRLCRDLGHDGYREFRVALAGELAVREQVWLERDSESDIGEGDDIAQVIVKITTSNIRAVEETARAQNIEQLVAVARAVLAARRIVVVGMGASGLVAADLALKLQRIARPANSHGDVHTALTTVALMTPHDVLVVISHSGTTRDTLDVIQLATDLGVTTVAITNAPRSPLAQLATHLLPTAAHEASFRASASASRLAQLTVVDCVFVTVAQLSYAESHEALTRTAAALAQRR